jgi:hypothetical protein
MTSGRYTSPACGTFSKTLVLDPSVKCPKIFFFCKYWMYCSGTLENVRMQPNVVYKPRLDPGLNK